MRGLDELAPVLGEPLRPANTTVLNSLAALWGLTLPEDFVEILSAYGDSRISDYLMVYGPTTLGFGGEFFGPGLPDWSVEGDESGIPLLPTPGGLLLTPTEFDEPAWPRVSKHPPMETLLISASQECPICGLPVR